MNDSEELSFRRALTVNEIVLFENGDSYPVCPRCLISIEREYMSYCDRCGQCLSWKFFYKAKIKKKF